jgi:hypothetical protein
MFVVVVLLQRSSDVTGPDTDRMQDVSVEIKFWMAGDDVSFSKRVIPDS